MKHKLAFVSDTHCGSIVGLWPGRHAIEGGGIYEANKAQQWMGKCWAHAAREIRKCDTVVLEGDMIQGTNARDGQLIGSTTQTQVDAALTLLKPALEKAERIYALRGTEWHDGKAAEHCEQLAQRLNAVVDQETGQYSRWEMYLDVGGPVIHSSHHIGVSSVPSYELTIPLRDTMILLSELSRFFGGLAPNVRLVTRSHRHRFAHGYVAPDTQVFVTPGWQLKTAFAFKKGASLLPQIGWVLVEWDGRDLTVKPRLYPLPALAVERIDADNNTVEV